MSSKNIIIVGPPGSGKGTHGSTLAEEYEFKIVVTGEMLRTISKSKTDLGREVKRIIDKGELIPDKTIDEILIEYLNDQFDSTELKNIEGLLIDGYPRTINQAETLENLINVDEVIFLDVDEEESVKRILKRGENSNREDDKDESIIRSRIQTYLKDTYPVIEYYKNQGKLNTIDDDGSRSIEDIYKEIQSIL